MSLKFYKCNTCGNVFEVLVDKKIKPICCGKIMEELVANTVDAAAEKHVPVVNVNGNEVIVEVGSVTHPMLDVHYITFIILETSKGAKRVNLVPGEAPRAVFNLCEGEVAIAAYEYCNLHGLWKTVL